MREQNWCDVVDSLIVFLWVMFLIGGCTYLVFWKDASGWWYVLAILLASTAQTSYARELKEYYKEEK
jgi:hypothetical protein